MQIISRVDAKTRGFTRFFTGKPCCRGHVAERHVSGYCIECNKEMKRSDWYIAYQKTYSSNYYVKNRQRLIDAACKNHSAQMSENQDYVLARNRLAKKRRRAKEPERYRAEVRNRRAKQRAAEGIHTAADTKRIRVAQGNRCAYCRESLGRDGHLDHIIAIANGGSNWPRNLQWLCASCNTQKHAKDPIEFAQSRGLLL
jgi:5-methylcytosine-specific restriction endonuclease McrA